MVILQLEEQPAIIQSIFSGELDEIKELIACKQDVNCLDCESRSPLHAAAFKGDPDIVSVLLANGARVNARDTKFITPLHRACAVNSEEIVDLLLRYDADVTARDKHWQTPLHVAAANDAYQCVELLLNAVPNANVTDRSGRTALHHAAYNGHTYIADLLISRGCIVNACDKKDMRPLHCAVRMGHIDTVDLLLRCGADVNVCGHQGNTPLHVAAGTGNDSISRLLLNAGADIDAKNYSGNTALHIACLNGQLLVCQDLISSGADLEAANNLGQTPLHIAASSTHGVECLLYLLSQNVDLNKQSKNGRTPLHMTAIYGRFTRSKSLLDKGAKIDCVDSYGCTPLHIAALYGHDLLANTLLSCGANPMQKGYEGRTPLHICCLSGYVECCRKFLQAGVNLNVQDDKGMTPIHCAAYKGSVDCLDLLVSNGANFLTLDSRGRLAVHYAASKGHYQCVFTLVGIGSPTNARDSFGCTPLHLAAGYDLEGKCVEYLLQHRADPLARDNRGFTPLHYAVGGRNITAVKLLLCMNSAAAQVNDNEGNMMTPLHLAARGGNVEILQSILAYCREVDIRNSDGYTPLMLATLQRYKGAVQLLLRYGAKVSERCGRYGMTPLHYTAKAGQQSSLRLMLQSDDGIREINSLDNLQRTPLMVAVLEDNIECVEILLNFGADPNIVDSDKHSSLFMAVVTRLHRIVDVLLENNAQPNTSDVNGKKVFHLAAACGDLPCLKTVIGHLTDDEAKALDNQECSVLHWACYNEHSACVEYLLQKDVFKNLEGNAFSPIHCATYSNSQKSLILLVNYYGSEVIHLKDCRKRTPLHIAALHGHVECAKYLLDQGAEVNVCDEDGRTPFIAAAQYGRSKVIELLLNYKVDRGSQDKQGNTALHWACLKNHSHTALLLLEDMKDDSLVSIANNERKTALHLAARNGLVDVTRELLKKGASVLAVDSDGFTPALCCAPNKSVAQCLSLILQNLTTIPVFTHLPENEPLIKPFNADRKTQQVQTKISLLNDPDAFEIKQMFGVRFPGDKPPKSPSSPRHSRKKPKDLFRSESDCFLIENGDDDEVPLPQDPAGGLDLHKSYSDMSIAARAGSASDFNSLLNSANLKELCDRNMGCRECMVLQHRCSDCTIRHVLRQHLQGKTTSKEFRDFLMKTLNETSSEYRQKFLRAIDSIGKEFGLNIDQEPMETSTPVRKDKSSSKSSSRCNKRPEAAKKQSLAKIKMWNEINNKSLHKFFENERAAMEQNVEENGCGSFRGSSEYSSLRSPRKHSSNKSPQREALHLSNSVSCLQEVKSPKRHHEKIGTSRSSDGFSGKHSDVGGRSDKISKRERKKEIQYGSDFLKNLKKVKLECLKQKEEEYFQTISAYISSLMDKCNSNTMEILHPNSECQELQKLSPVNEEQDTTIVKIKCTDDEQVVQSEKNTTNPLEGETCLKVYIPRIIDSKHLNINIVLPGSLSVTIPTVTSEVKEENAVAPEPKVEEPNLTVEPIPELVETELQEIMKPRQSNPSDEEIARTDCEMLENNSPLSDITLLSSEDDADEIQENVETFDSTQSFFAELQENHESDDDSVACNLKESASQFEEIGSVKISKKTKLKREISCVIS